MIDVFNAEHTYPYQKRKPIYHEGAISDSIKVTLIANFIFKIEA